ncbi:hypothetical protein HZU75_06565 [Chitinibacter fontanus]|uniref:Erythromycin biosynthesis protein CIII-like C-terminal domain-containing protein n=1 Tax=Chitinibacter fontanus TaxID=1737446 RepID=A0A7D5Z2N1_9NEIS|nr:nucleotide disphospho-sugar-binding domain-containing protein [Chitinibacter fontanus]QLI81221.1 hypothetical protein HZU75_06565 [Chitinibacter fontanus]
MGQLNLGNWGRFQSARTNGLSRILAALIQRNDCTIICIIPGFTPQDAQAWTRPHCQIQTRPIDLSALLVNADLVVNEGGHGLVTETLAAGVPMLLAPEFIEQYMLAQRVLQLGVGLVSGAVRSTNVVSKHLSQLMGDEIFEVNASKFSVRYNV